MDYKQYYKTQLEAAKAINQIVDAYWMKQITRGEMSEWIQEILLRNGHILLRDDELRVTTMQRLGKKRTPIVQDIYNEMLEGEGL